VRGVLDAFGPGECAVEFDADFRVHS
jgi:hypothetical protein